MPSAEITKKALAEALKELMAVKPLSKISISGIADCCGINRNSFYYHFKDKNDLVNWIFYTEVSQILNREEIYEVPARKALDVLTHYFYLNHSFYRSALSVSGQNSFSEYFHDTMQTLFMAKSRGFFEMDEYQEFFAAFYADACTAALHRWMLGELSTPPEQISRLIYNALAGASALLND